MSTNYYLERKSHGCDKSQVHIGKASAGWAFLFKADPSWGQDQALTMWLQLVHTKGFRIVTEYGDKVKEALLLTLIMAGQTGKSHVNDIARTGSYFFQVGGFDFCSSEFD